MTNEDYILAKDFPGLLQKNSRYIELKANSFNQDYETVKDLEQAGRCGLFDAYNKYDSSKGPFWPFAKWHIVKEMTAWLDKFGRVIRLPNNVLYDKDYVSTTKTVSLDAPLHYDSDDTLNDIVSEPVADDNILLDIMYQRLNKLSETEQNLLKMYFGLDGDDGMNGEEIGKVLGISRQAVSLKINKVLEKLKDGYQPKTKRKPAIRRNS